MKYRNHSIASKVTYIQKDPLQNVRMTDRCDKLLEDLLMKYRERNKIKRTHLPNCFICWKEVLWLSTGPSPYDGRHPPPWNTAVWVEQLDGQEYDICYDIVMADFIQIHFQCISSRFWRFPECSMAIYEEPMEICHGSVSKIRKIHYSPKNHIPMSLCSPLSKVVERAILGRIREISQSLPWF